MSSWALVCENCFINHLNKSREMIDQGVVGIFLRELSVTSVFS